MVSVSIFVVFVLLMLAGVPIGVALMLGGAIACFFTVASLDEADTPALPFSTPPGD